MPFLRLGTSEWPHPSIFSRQQHQNPNTSRRFTFNLDKPWRILVHFSKLEKVAFHQRPTTSTTSTACYLVHDKEFENNSGKSTSLSLPRIIALATFNAHSDQSSTRQTTACLYLAHSPESRVRCDFRLGAGKVQYVLLRMRWNRCCITIANSFAVKYLRKS